MYFNEMITVYMEVTQDSIELPLIVADTAKELADKTGVDVQAIYKSVSRVQLGQRKRGRFVKVTFDE